MVFVLIKSNVLSMPKTTACKKHWHISVGVARSIAKVACQKDTCRI
jgi:hypothetical protein